MPHLVLAEDWSDYDNRKIRDGRDRNRFSCEENWEVEYLIGKVTKVYPQYSRDQVRTAITRCCNSGVDRMRDAFVRCVMERLRA